MLTTTAHEANRAGVVFEIANKCAGDALFGHALGFFFFCADLHYGGRIALDAGLAGYLGLLVRIDVFNVNFGRQICVLIEQIFALLKTRGLIEIGDGRVLLQSLGNFRSLIRQAVALVRGPVIGLVVPVRENVRHHDNSDHHQNIDNRVSRVLGLPRSEQLCVHLRPPAQRFHGAGGEEQPQEDDS